LPQCRRDKWEEKEKSRQGPRREILIEKRKKSAPNLDWYYRHKVRVIGGGFVIDWSENLLRSRVTKNRTVRSMAEGGPEGSLHIKENDGNLKKSTRRGREAKRGFV